MTVLKSQLDGAPDWYVSAWEETGYTAETLPFPVPDPAEQCLGGLPAPIREVRVMTIISLVMPLLFWPAVGGYAALEYGWYWLLIGLWQWFNALKSIVETFRVWSDSGYIDPVFSR